MRTHNQTLISIHRCRNAPTILLFGVSLTARIGSLYSSGYLKVIWEIVMFWPEVVVTVVAKPWLWSSWCPFIGVDDMIIRRYILCVAAKSAHGIGVPGYYSTHTALSGFCALSYRLCPNYGGCVRLLRKRRVWVAGYANLTQFTTSRLASLVVMVNLMRWYYDYSISIPQNDVYPDLPQ